MDCGFGIADCGMMLESYQIADMSNPKSEIL